MSSRFIKWLAVPALALAVFVTSPASPNGPTNADAAPGTVAAKRDKSPTDQRIKPLQSERDVRYTSESTQLPSTARCDKLPANSANWPKNIVSCYGPPPKPSVQAPAAPPASAPAAGTSAGRASTGQSGGGSTRPHQPAPSCG